MDMFSLECMPDEAVARYDHNLVAPEMETALAVGLWGTNGGNPRMSLSGSH